MLFCKLGGTYTGAIKPRNPQQICLFDMLKDKTSKIKLVTGRFGSGKTLAMTNAALELIEKGKFERIIFVKIDRYFRSVAEYWECQKILETNNVTWTATEEKYDLSTANGRAFVNMKLTIAELEADQTSERIKLVNEYKVNAEYISCDLSRRENCIDLYSKVKNIDILVNNAGLGDFGEFSETELTKDFSIIDTNITSVHILTKLYLNLNY